MQYTYVLVSEKDGNFYTGLTGDLERRLDLHNAGEVPSTKHRRPFRLVYYEACLSRQDAAAREKYLKSGMGKRFLRNRLKATLEGLSR
jgi:putative endonuclease